jgi:hypothetical protein
MLEMRLNPQIPTCSNSRILTAEETAESRMVTKCRFIIEKKLGDLKKNKALDHRQNNEVHHLQTDYRIACSMLNFSHKPCCADESDADDIASTLRNKCLFQNENPLEILVGKIGDQKIRFGTINIPYNNFSELNNFPKLSEEQMKNEIFFGSYYIKQSKSYLADVLKQQLYVKITHESLVNLNITAAQRNKLLPLCQESEIIGMELPSRHGRSFHSKHRTSITDYQIKDFRNNYTVFIRYQADLNSPAAIKCMYFLILIEA